MEIDALVCQNIRGMRPYESPPILDCEIKLNQNESPNDLPSWLKQKIIERIKNMPINRYNEGSSKKLRELLAERFTVNPENIIIGAGIDELLYYITLTFAKEGDTIVRFSPSFAIYKTCSAIVKAKDTEITLNSDFSLPEEFIKKIINAKITFICRPNNPTGNLIDKRILEELVKNAKGLICIDEAYVEFSDDNCLDLLKYENVIILRTLSKAFGAAGIRIGYAIADRRIIEYLDRIKLPWNVSVLSQIVAEEILENAKWFEFLAEETKKERSRVLKRLQEIKGLEVYPSKANFILFKVKNAEAIFEKLTKRSILIRKFSSPLLKDCLRMTIGKRQENDAFVEALKEILRIQFDLIIFDIDGVLVDVSQSYREAIKQTVITKNNRIINNEDIEKLKKIPGFNNDWDVSYALIYGITNPKTIDRNSKAYLEIKEIFQRTYMGKKLFEKEKLLIREETLQQLRKKAKLGVVTSRPRKEALAALNNFIPNYFDSALIVALEDCSLGKPNPEPLLFLKKRVNASNCVYVGDTVNDQLAAETAGMTFISVKPGLKADFYIQNINKILEVIDNEN